MKNLKKIKDLVSELEMERIDRVIKEIYSIDDGSNHSVAFQLGFDTVANCNGAGYENLVIIVDSLNDGGEVAEFARFILGKVLPSDKIEMLKKELEVNRNHYIRFLYL